MIYEEKNRYITKRKFVFGVSTDVDWHCGQFLVALKGFDFMKLLALVVQDNILENVPDAPEY